ncbi:diacylglycerol kinase [Streptomyces sp. NPDC057621]|uniref:Diacylglycerol kinase n=1 Tax=Streptomyces liliiviolaceus TaxID=2823109 RepID=A0A940XQD2_9ACTN|nr:diacylglycerol kinase [Streptomyces liliiviolaceus]MBQ0848090.1 diacylglycerol kinase [Streptomyces liliiviolaceus]
MTEVATSDQLLVVIDPVARHGDGEAVRIAKDVLSAGATAKVCLPDGPEEFDRALARRGSRRPVVIGDDRALLRAVSLLHRRRELAGCALSLVPVGVGAGALTLSRALGVPMGAVAAARAVLDGSERRLDLLVDDSDGVVLGALRIPPLGGGEGSSEEEAPHHRAHWLRTCQSLVRTLAARPARPPASASPGPARLRVEVDGRTLIDLDQPVDAVSITPGGAGGGARIEIRPVSVGAEAAPLEAVARTITVSGADFRYRADAVVAGPVRTRTWTVREGAWGLTLPG